MPELLTLGQAFKWGQEKLKPSKTAALDARVILANLLQCSTASLLNEPQKKMSGRINKMYKRAISQRKRSVPVAYITGEKEFYGITLKVNSHVLIPRPTSEAIVETTISLSKKLGIKNIYEIGTGSGAIAIALAVSLPEVKIFASDISSKALTVAKENIRKKRLSKQIKLVRANLGEHIKEPALVVANLPYLSEKLRNKKDLAFEPAMALFADGDGLGLYKKMFSNLPFVAVVIELGERQYSQMAKWLKQKFPKAKISPVRDLDKTICGLVIIS